MVFPGRKPILGDTVSKFRLLASSACWDSSLKERLKRENNLLLNIRIGVCACVCVRAGAHVCVCVRAREKEAERETERHRERKREGILSQPSQRGLTLEERRITHFTVQG